MTTINPSYTTVTCNPRLIERSEVHIDSTGKVEYLSLFFNQEGVKRMTESCPAFIDKVVPVKKDNSYVLRITDVAAFQKLISSIKMQHSIQSRL